MHAPANPWLSEFLEERESIKKNPTKSNVTKEKNIHTAPTEELGKLVEKTGKQMEFFGAQRAGWTREEREKRLAQVIATQNQLDAALAASGSRLEPFGWTVTRNGLWQRVNRRAAEWQETECEKVFIATVRQVAELLLEVPEAEQAGLRRTRLETVLNEALAAGCIERLSVACAAYLDWATEVKSGSRVDQAELALGNAA